MKNETMFKNLEKELEITTGNKIISEKLIILLQKAENYYILFEEKILNVKDMLQKLNLMSALNTYRDVLHRSIILLKKSKSNNKNSDILKSMYEILFLTIKLGNKLDNIFNGKYDTIKSFELKNIRNITLTLQDEAEEKGFIESINKKIDKIPVKTRQSLYNRLTLM